MDKEQKKAVMLLKSLILHYHGLDDDGLASPGSNYTYGTAQQHGSTAYHGTHVCGTVAGRHFGWAKEANIYSINVLSPSAVQTYLTTDHQLVLCLHR